jgi:hypothetical protein
MKIKVLEQVINFEVDEGDGSELLFLGNEQECSEFFENGGTKEDLKSAIETYMKDVNNISLVFESYGNLHCRLWFNIDTYELIKSFK